MTGASSVEGAHSWRRRPPAYLGKVHLLVDRETGHVLATELIGRDTHDCEVLPAMLPGRLAGGFVLGDSAYHTRDCHRAVFGRGGTLLAPPMKGARLWKPHHWVTGQRPRPEGRGLSLIRAASVSSRSSSRLRAS